MAAREGELRQTEASEDTLAAKPALQIVAETESPEISAQKAQLHIVDESLSSKYFEATKPINVHVRPSSVSMLTQIRQHYDPEYIETLSRELEVHAQINETNVAWLDEEHAAAYIKEYNALFTESPVSLADLPVDRLGRYRIIFAGHNRYLAQRVKNQRVYGDPDGDYMPMKFFNNIDFYEAIEMQFTENTYSPPPPAQKARFIVAYFQKGIERGVFNNYAGCAARLNIKERAITQAFQYCGLPNSIKALVEDARSDESLPFAAAIVLHKLQGLCSEDEMFAMASRIAKEGLTIKKVRDDVAEILAFEGMPMEVKQLVILEQFTRPQALKLVALKEFFEDDVIAELARTAARGKWDFDKLEQQLERMLNNAKMGDQELGITVAIDEAEMLRQRRQQEVANEARAIETALRTITDSVKRHLLGLNGGVELDRILGEGYLNDSLRDLDSALGQIIEHPYASQRIVATSLELRSKMQRWIEAQETGVETLGLFN